MKRKTRARTIPLVDGLDWTVPWAILPATLTEIASLIRHSAIPVPSMEDRGPGPVAQLDTDRGASRTAGAVAVLTLRGVITPRASWLSILFGGGYGLDMFRESFREALADDDITAILIEVDSPGGRSDLITETAREIRAARGGTKPIVAIANTLAASAGYWIASQADELVVTPSGYVGSIGTYITHLETSKYDEARGFTYTLIGAGKYKTDGNELQPLSDTAKANYQEIVDACHNMFVADVAAGRGTDDATVRNGYGQGHMLTPDAALAEGMVDRIETFEQTVSRLVTGRSAPAGSDTNALTQQNAVRITAQQHEQLQTQPASSNPPPTEREAVTDGHVPPWQLIPTPHH